MTKPITLIAAGAALLGMTACASGPRDPGINDSQQDEFRVVTMAPLTVPPDYGLRPPAQGQALPTEVEVDRVQTTAFGSTIGQNASAGERALIAEANANAVSPVIRAQIDYEQAGIIRRSSTLTDRVLFWRDTDEEAVAIAESDSATGGAAVTIARGDGRIKLPGT